MKGTKGNSLEDWMTGLRQIEVVNTAVEWEGYITFIKGYWGLTKCNSKEEENLPNNNNNKNKHLYKIV